MIFFIILYKKKKISAIRDLNNVLWFKAEDIINKILKYKTKNTIIINKYVLNNNKQTINELLNNNNLQSITRYVQKKNIYYINEFGVYNILFSLEKYDIEFKNWFIKLFLPL